MREIIIISILVFSVLSSKQILIYNEEIIVALSFIAFIIFTSRNFGNSIKESFDARSDLISKQLQQSLDSQQTLLSELIQQRSTGIHASIVTIGDSLLSDASSIAQRCKQSIAMRLANIFEQKLKTTLNIQESANLQQKIKHAFRQIVWDEFRFSKLQKHQSKLVQQSIVLLKRGA